MVMFTQVEGPVVSGGGNELVWCVDELVGYGLLLSFVFVNVPVDVLFVCVVPGGLLDGCGGYWRYPGPMPLLDIIGGDVLLCGALLLGYGLLLSFVLVKVPVLVDPVPLGGM